MEKSDLPILVIIPRDKTTRFLNKITSHLQRNIGERISIFRIRPNEESHNECLQRIQEMPKNSLVIFLGHGRSNYLYGAADPTDTTFSSSDFLSENPEIGFDKGAFIHEKNISIFSGKQMFCLACNAGREKGIGSKSIESGCNSFIGFEEIPTSSDEFEERLNIPDVPKPLIGHYKGEINFIIKTSLEIALNNDYSMLELVHLIKLITNKRAHFIRTTWKGYKDSRLLAELLFMFRSGIHIYGQQEIKAS